MDVIGGGNAALSAAIAARRIVQRVLVLERAPSSCEVEIRGILATSDVHTRALTSSSPLPTAKKSFLRISSR